jgi:protease-4
VAGPVAGAVTSTLVAPARALARWARGRLTRGAGAVAVDVDAIEDLVERHAFLARLRRLGADPGVRVVSFRVRGVPGSFASVQDLRAVIAELSDTGTATVALLDNPGNAELWLGSACDRVFLVPSGSVNATGIGAEILFFGDALARFGVGVEVLSVGEYKGAGEPYSRGFSSPENREAMGALVRDLEASMVADVARAREIDEDAVRDALAAGPLLADEALDRGLVDDLAYPDQVEALLRAELGDDARIVDFGTWARVDRALSWLERVGGPSVGVAVLHLQGAIVESGGAADAIDAEQTVLVVRALREADEVRAVVLNVDSPGGSAYGSDLIWREVELLGREKPVVAVFEDVAASGGYYVAAPATRVVARATTLTGSIGVVGGKPVVADAMRRVGVRSEVIATSPNAAMFSPTRPFTDEQRERVGESMFRVYAGFVSRVAAGRRRPIEALEPHCRGRVWSGAAAAERGLVDVIGDLSVGVALARRYASLTPTTSVRWDVSTRPRRSWLTRRIQRWVRDLLPGASVLADRVVGSALVRVFATSGPWLVLPFDVRLR